MTGSIHATAVLAGERGVLLRGRSGAGKSRLALALIAGVRGLGGFAALIADDRVWLEAAHGRLIARGAPALGGLCERRGEGLVEAPHEALGVLRLVVDISTQADFPPRMPNEEDKYDRLENVVLPRLRLHLASGVEDGVFSVISALQRIEDGSWRKNLRDNPVLT